MLSALLVTNAMPRNTHIVPSVMMNGCTRNPTTITPLASPHSNPMPRHSVMPTSTVSSGLENCHARNAIAMVVPASAYTEPTDRSMPPEMITIVAPTAMMAKKLASVAVWVSV